MWSQFAAAIDTLGQQLESCPEDLWHERLWRKGPDEEELSEFWYVGYHALFWLDLYLYGSEEGFNPPPPYELIEMERPYRLPDPAYSKGELAAYLALCRARCRAAIENLTTDKARETCRFPWGEVTYFELLLYNLRHVQEHAAQLSLFLGNNGVSVPDYVTLVTDRIALD